MNSRERFFAERNEDGRLVLDGSAVLRARAAAGLTQAEVSQRVNLLGYMFPQPYVSMVERNRYPWGFTERMATAIAAVLGVGLTKITGGRLISRADANEVQTMLNKIDALAGSGDRPATLAVAGRSA